MKKITNNLLNGCIDLLKSKGVLDENIIISQVPGSFELIYASKKLQMQDVDSVIAIGSVIRGETSILILYVMQLQVELKT